MIVNAHLDPQVKTKWLNALRSREFKQGRDVLEEDNQFCCLGVLAKVLNQDRKIDMGDVYLPTSLAAKIFNCTTPVSKSIQNELSNRNDGNEDGIDALTGQKYYTGSPQKFYQIARWIERNL